MGFYLVTGQSGTGKSTLLRQLNERGYEAYGTDEDAVAMHSFVRTGQILTSDDYKPHKRDSIDWLNAVEYKIVPYKFKQLEQLSQSDDVYVLGGADDLADYYDYFDIIFALLVDEGTLKHRLSTRTDNDWGKQPHELAYIMERFKSVGRTYQELGAIIIDAARPIEVVADNILGYTSSS